MTSDDATLVIERPLASADETEALGRALGEVLDAGDVLVLTGPLGAGKTTLTRGLGEALGVRGPVQSPTFVIARTHPNLGDGPNLIHVDAYRLADPLELDDLDLDLAASVTVIEWGADAVSAIADSWLEVVLERERAAGDERHATVRATGPAWHEQAGVERLRSLADRIGEARA